MIKHFDVAVVGLGGMGCASVYHLATAGLRVLGLDQFGPIDPRRASRHFRGVRHAYFDDDRHVELAIASTDAFRELQVRASQQLLWQPGGLLVGPPRHPVMSGVQGSARKHSLELEVLSADDLESRFSALRFDPGSAGLLEKNAGYVDADAVNAAHLALAPKATIRWNSEVERVDRESEHIVLHTREGRFTASRVVMTTGAWLWDTLGLTLHRQWQVVLPMMTSLPLFNVVSDESPHSFYGLPTGANQMAVGQHQGGRICTLDNAFAPAAPRELDLLTQFVENVLGQSVDESNTRVGLYALGATGRGQVELDPSDERVVFVGGFSGHGYKFAPEVGRSVVALIGAGPSASSFSIWRSPV